jgi:hypothetical protein
VANVIENIMATCDGLGDMKLCGIKLEDASRDLLNVMDGFLDQHVAMQPAAMAYYLTLKKTAKRRLDNAHAAHDRWEKKLYALSKAAVESGTTAKSAIKVEDVKARFIVDNEPEIEKWEARIGRAQEEYDTLDAWCEAWKQKSFSLREYISIEEDERFSGSDSIAENRKGGNARTDDDQRIDRVRQMIRKKRNQSTV